MSATHLPPLGLSPMASDEFDRLVQRSGALGTSCPETGIVGLDQSCSIALRALSTAAFKLLARLPSLLLLVMDGLQITGNAREVCLGIGNLYAASSGR